MTSSRRTPYSTSSNEYDHRPRSVVSCLATRLPGYHELSFSSDPSCAGPVTFGGCDSTPEARGANGASDKGQDSRMGIEAQVDNEASVGVDLRLRGGGEIQDQGRCLRVTSTYSFS